MPNHFHLMVLVNNLILDEQVEGFAQSENLAKRTLNQSIGIMLRSYTNAINKQQNRTGSLFRKLTKAECLNCLNGIVPPFYNKEFATQIPINNQNFQYAQVCFSYIHQNPVKAGLVKTETAWEFSSAMDYAGLRNGSLINKAEAFNSLCYDQLTYYSIEYLIEN